MALLSQPIIFELADYIMFVLTIIIAVFIYLME